MNEEEEQELNELVLYITNIRNCLTTPSVLVRELIKKAYQNMKMENIDIMEKEKDVEIVEDIQQLEIELLDIEQLEKKIEYDYNINRAKLVDLFDEKNELLEDLKLKKKEKEKKIEGRPRKHLYENSLKTCVTFDLNDIIYLDRLCTNVLENTGINIDRGDIIRACVSAVLSIELDFNKINSREEIKEKILSLLQENREPKS